MPASTADILARLADNGWVLPAPSPAGGAYVPVRVAGGWATVAIQFPKAAGQVVHPGVIGETVTAQQAHEAARHCALNVLAQLHAYVGLHRIEAVMRIDGSFQCVPGFTDWPTVLDGASNVFLTAFGEDIGSHARSLQGVAQLPLNAAVVLTNSLFLVQT